ncbi:MAG: type VI secretion system baseplate subunit TssF [Bacteroidota bacterium]
MQHRYFENEMRYLHEAGQAFAKAFPEAAGYLNIDSVDDRDPYVERLFEGFAFLTARIHERLDDELPEYTESLIGLLYPNFLKPIPSSCIVEMQPRPGLVQETTVLPRGTSLSSGPVGRERCPCEFQTSQDVRLQPVQLTDVALRYASDDTSSALLSFELARGVEYADLDWQALRAYLHADPVRADTMRWFLTQRVTRVEFMTEPEQLPGERFRLVGQRWVQAGGFEPEASLLPRDTRVASGLRLLQEYLNFRPKFSFVDLHGLDHYHPPSGTRTFHVEVFFDTSYPEDRRFDASHVRLFCTPATNLFEANAEPIRLTHRDFEYRVRPNVRQRQSVQPYDLTEVVGIEDISGARHPFAPFLRLDQRSSQGEERTYSLHRRYGPAGTPDLYLTFSVPLPSVGDPVDESVSLTLRCTNGSLPHEELSEGALTRLDPAAPQIVTPTNITAPTLIRYPPSDRQDLFWSLIAHWSFNHRSVATHEAVTGLLDLYDWTQSGGNRRRREGIRAVQWAGAERLVGRSVRRGTEVTVEVGDAHFGSEGELHLFGQVLSTFFSLYATLNSFVHLHLVSAPSGRRYACAPQRGTRPVL